MSAIPALSTTLPLTAASRIAGSPLNAYNAAAGRQGRAFGPRLWRAPSGAPLTAVGGVVALGHARTPPRKAQLSEAGPLEVLGRQLEGTPLAGGDGCAVV
jgi:hypothetical protein